jgi:hypothetical protein
LKHGSNFQLKRDAMVMSDRRESALEPSDPIAPIPGRDATWKSAAGGVQVLEVCEVTGSPGGSLHGFEVVDRADGHRDPEDLGIVGPRAQFLVAGDSL